MCIKSTYYVLNPLIEKSIFSNTLVLGPNWANIEYIFKSFLLTAPCCYVDLMAQICQKKNLLRCLQPSQLLVKAISILNHRVEIQPHWYEIIPVQRENVKSPTINSQYFFSAEGHTNWKMSWCQDEKQFFVIMTKKITFSSWLYDLFIFVYPFITLQALARPCLVFTVAITQKNNCMYKKICMKTAKLGCLYWPKPWRTKLRKSACRI